MLRGIVILLALALATSAQGGYITPPLAEKLNELSAGATIEALVMFEHQADIASLNQQLKQEKATLAERNRRVLLALHEAADRTQPAMIDFLDQLKKTGMVEDYQMLWIANMFWVRATAAGIMAIAERPELAELYLNSEIELIEPVELRPDEPQLTTAHEVGLDRIRAPEAWAMGYTGRGRVVSTLDTGVDGTHPALASRWRGTNGGTPQNSWYDPYANQTYPFDSGYHGTHTMGTVCGRSTVPPYDTIGVAIDALWIAAAPIDRGGGIARTIADALLSFQWIADPDRNPLTQDNPDACGNSWGIPDNAGYPNCDQTFWAAIDNVEAAGTVVIFSAGNEGTAGLRSPADRATTPYNVFSVGAVDGNNSTLPIASFSARGPTECATGPLAIKPEVVAPGVLVRSAQPGNRYQSLSGTSMASPHVTGAVAILRDVNPDLDADSIKAILIRTARDLPLSNPNGEDNTFGHGIIDLYEACRMAEFGYGRVRGYVRNPENQAIAGARITVLGTSRMRQTDSTGFYNIGLPGDTTYRFVVVAFGYLPETSLVAVTQGDTTNFNFVLNYAPYGAVEGYVRDSDSLPLPQAVVRVLNTPLAPVTSDSSGHYIISDIPGNDSFTIEAVAAGHGTKSARVFVPVNQTVNLNFYLPLMESFELGTAGWTGSGDWQWGQPTSGPGQAFDGQKVWATVLSGNYRNNALDPLVTARYSITDSNATFSFYHWYDFETRYDGGNVSISTDDGATWTLIFPQTGYDHDSIVGLGRVPGFTSSSNGWVQEVFNVGAYFGQMVKFRFLFGSDGSVVRAGWYIDGVVVEGAVAWGSMPPSLTNVSPPSFNVFLDSGGTVTLPLTLSNGGPGILEYSATVVRNNPRPLLDLRLPALAESSAGVEVTSNDALTYYHYDGKKEDDLAVTSGGDVITNRGGPDQFGYFWLDSREPGGPTYRWVDITTRGTRITGLYDDTNVGPFPIGFSFPFYNREFTTFRFCTNGWISFTSTASFPGNSNLPDPNAPRNLIAPFWDDLDFRSAGRAYYLSTGDSLIVSWIDVPHYSSPGGPYRFQVILLENGEIFFQYDSIGTRPNENTIGIQDSTGSIGLTVAFNQAFAVSRLAVRFVRPVQWLTLRNSSGAVLPGQQGTIDVVFDSRILSPGVYTGQITITTNDPAHVSVTVPCTLNVTVVGVESAEAGRPTTYELSQNYPNPFNSATEIAFALPQPARASLVIYDILGRQVRNLVDAMLSAGHHRLIWDGRSDDGGVVASGIYFYRLSAGEMVLTKRMMMLK